MRRMNIPAEELFPHAARLLAEGRSVEVRVLGSSMFPFLRSGQRILLEPAGATPLRRGDVVLARTDLGRWVVHRIVRCDADEVILMGDGNIAASERVAPSAVAGRMAQSCMARVAGRVWLSVTPLRRVLIPAARRAGLIKPQ